MYLSEEFSGFPRRDEPRRSVPSRSSKGYPERRDPAAERPSGILNQNLGDTGLRKLRQHYAPANHQLRHM